MESLDLRLQLDCPLCSQLYRDPVNLRCGHSFCRACMDNALDAQQWGSGYSCPVCREPSVERPVLHPNLSLHNIAEDYKLSLAQQQPKPIVINEATIAKASKLRSVLKRLEAEIHRTDERARSVEERGMEIEEKEADGKERAATLFRDIRRQLADLERKVQRDISLKAEKLSDSIINLGERLKALKSDLIQQKQIKSSELSEIESVLTPDILAELERSGTGDTEEDIKGPTGFIQDVGDLDMTEISLTLHKGLWDIIYGAIHARLQPSSGSALCPYPTPTLQQTGLEAEEDLILDIDTASFQLHISDDRKTAARPTSQSRPDSPDRFWTFPQVLSTRTFSSGRHSWEVDVGGIDWCCVAMCYPSMDRNGRRSKMEDNTKAWCVVKLENKYFVKHNWKEARPPAEVSSNRIRVSLDYEAGQISFYELCDPIQLLHTFIATFTEPLHAALGVYSEVGCMKIVGYNREN